MSNVDPGVTGRRRTAARKPAKRRKNAHPPSEPPLTISVPEAGRKYFGLSKNGSYAAASRGDIPTIQVGKLRRVPVRLMERMLETAATHNNA
jgi:hypothetical protein